MISCFKPKNLDDFDAIKCRNSKSARTVNLCPQETLSVKKPIIKNNKKYHPQESFYIFYLKAFRAVHARPAKNLNLHH